VRDQATRIPVPVAYQGDGWSDAFADTSVYADTLDLAPYGYRILRNGSP
jgi:hypothetical protein